MVTKRRILRLSRDLTHHREPRFDTFDGLPAHPTSRRPETIVDVANSRLAMTGTAIRFPRRLDEAAATQLHCRTGRHSLSRTLRAPTSIATPWPSKPVPNRSSCPLDSGRSTASSAGANWSQSASCPVRLAQLASTTGADGRPDDDSRL
jgi:hypothetical protein